MAKILILEPHPDIRALFQRVVARLGHEALVDLNCVTPDAVLVEPVSAPGRRAVEELRRTHAGLPVVCASIEPETQELRRTLSPIAYLVKPVRVTELERVLTLAVEQTSASA